jgi:hypothetical protein
MTRITLDNATLRRLLDTSAECVDVCHPGGYVVGSFSPGLTWERVLASAPPLTEEERNDRLDGPSYTWAEVMEHLLSLAPLPEPPEPPSCRSRVVLDVAVLRKLLAVKNTAEICDEAGRVVGLFCYHFNPDDYENLEPQVTESELIHRLNSAARRVSTAEVMQRLEGL